MSNSSLSFAVRTKLLDPRLKAEPSLLSYGTNLSAGMDMRACIDEPLTIKAGEQAMVGLGIAISLAEEGIMAMLVPRSGLGSKGLILGNTVGIIDADYQGEIKACVWNRSNEDKVIQPMDRIAQLLVVPAFQITPVIVEEFEASARGEGGFGSTGTA